MAKITILTDPGDEVVVDGQPVTPGAGPGEPEPPPGGGQPDPYMGTKDMAHNYGNDRYLMNTAGGVNQMDLLIPEDYEGGESLRVVFNDMNQNFAGNCQFLDETGNILKGASYGANHTIKKSVGPKKAGQTITFQWWAEAGHLHPDGYNIQMQFQFIL